MGLLYLLPEKIASQTLADLKSKLSESLVLSVFTSKSFTLDSYHSAVGSINFVKTREQKIDLNTAKSACNNLKIPFFRLQTLKKALLFLKNFRN